MNFQKEIIVQRGGLVLRHFWFWEKVTLSNFAVANLVLKITAVMLKFIHFQNNVLHDLHSTQLWGTSADFQTILSRLSLEYLPNCVK